MILKDKTVNFLGDSITFGYSLESEDERYLSVIERTYGLKAANCYGVSGTRIADNHKKNEQFPEADEYFVLRARKMDTSADAVVIFGGVNDYNHGDAELGCFDDRTSETFYGALHELYSTVTEMFYGKPIVVVTPLHRQNEYNLRGDGSKERDYYPLVRYVDIIKEVARYYSLPVCDLYANSGLQPNVPIICEKFIPDGLHPNAAGHKILAERIGNFLLAL